MCFDETLKEELEVVLADICDFQEKDRLANSTSMQIIKILAKFIEKYSFE
jgi:hypothetical protein